MAEIRGDNKKSAVITLIGIIVMILLTVTKVEPSSKVRQLGINNAFGGRKHYRGD